jgi:uncharacterized membrane protein (UPF0127 family)
MALVDLISNPSARRSAAASLASLAAALAVATMGASGCDPVDPAKDVEKVVIAGKTFQLKIAADDASRAKGMGGVKEFPADGGMIFIFPDAQPRSFWMVDCHVDLDIAFLDPLGIVTAVHTMPKEELRREGETLAAYQARLKKYSSGAPAQFAIEVQPGTFRTLGIKRGSKIDLDLKRLKGLAK